MGLLIATVESMHTMEKDDVRKDFDKVSIWLCDFGGESKEEKIHSGLGTV